MKNRLLFCAVACVLGMTAGCGSSNTNNANTTASPSPTAAASPKPSAAASPAATTGKGFLLVNSTGQDIYALYVAPSDSKEWGDDILGRDTLPDGERNEITFERSEKAPLWDLRIEDDKGGFVEWEGLNLLELKRVTLLIKNGKPTADTE